MKRTLIAAAGIALAAASGLASAASWTTIVAPGVYGRVPIGGYVEPPQVYSDQPIIAIAQALLGTQQGYQQPPAYYQQYQQQPPVYLWVPEYQRSHWAQSCNSYNACNVPVYFVQDRWYQYNVMQRRSWSADQRAWNQQQWLEQDRIARERWEQARWNREQSYRQQQEQQLAAQRAQQQSHWDQSRYDRDRMEHEREERVRWEQQHGRGVQAMPAWQPSQRPLPVTSNGRPPRPVQTVAPAPLRDQNDHDRQHERDHDHDRDGLGNVKVPYQHGPGDSNER